MAAPPGSKAYGKLSIAVQYRAEIELLEVVPATAFAPQPGVRSAIVRLTPRAPEYKLLDYSFFSRFLTAVFSQRRKKLKNSIAGFVAGFSGFAELSGVRLEDVGLPADILEKRPEELSAAALAEIANSIYSRMRN
jgi:16S rRNA (adenine1518-N6/adenine1519-N6)-dimethyltransferase